MGERINGYERLGDWHMVAEGAWAQVKKNGTVYFMKKYMNVATMPDRSKVGPLYTERAYQKHLDIFNSFKAKRDRINQTLWDLTDHGGNIVAPFDCFVYEHSYTEVTDFYEENLSEAKILALPMREKALLLRTLAGALKAIHSKGLVHSDIKSTNVVCTKTVENKYVLKLIDFGASFFVDDKPKEVEDFNGDQNYASPELSRIWMCEESEEDPEEYIAKLDQKSDIFSLGILFHLFLCGKRPLYAGINFSSAFGEREERLIYPFEIILHGGRLEVLHEITNETYRALISAMLQEDPAKRPTADEVLETLKKVPLPFKGKFSLLSAFKSSDKSERTEPSPRTVPTPPASIAVEVDTPWEEDDIVWKENIESLLKAKECKRLERKSSSFAKNAYCLVYNNDRRETLKKEDVIALGFASAIERRVSGPREEYGDTDEILRDHDKTLYHVNTELLRSKKIKLKPMERENSATRRTIYGYEVYDTVSNTKVFVATLNLVLQKYLLHKM